MITKPAYRPVIHRHIPQDQSPARTKYTVYTVEEILHVRIMVKTLATDHHIKTFRCKRQILTISYHQFHTFHILGLCHFDHLWCQIDPGIMFFRIFLMQQREHRRRSASAIQQIRKGFLFQFCKNIRVIFLAHLVYAALVCFIDLSCFGKFPYGYFFIFFVSHRNASHPTM